MKKNVILLGGSNSVMVNGLQKGLKQDHINLSNLALGSCTVLQNLYELKRQRNQEALKNADLIITESNINDIANHNVIQEKLPIENLSRSINWFYEELFSLGKKVLILLLPTSYTQKNAELIENMHKQNAIKYGFNLIDMQKYCDARQIRTFTDMFGAHQLASIMRELCVNISKHINEFKAPKTLHFKRRNPSFEICTVNTMSIMQGGGGMSF